MAAVVLAAERRADSYWFRVHLDETKVLPETGDPDPHWVEEWTWGLTSPDARLNAAQYLASIEAMLDETVKNAIETREARAAGQTLATIAGRRISKRVR